MQGRKTMKKIAPVLLSFSLLLSVAACSNTAKTSSSAPDSATQPDNQLDRSTAQTNQDDATSELRRRQLNADIRSREQRNDATGGDIARADGDLQSEVRSKLEANLPNSELTVDAKDGAVTIAGTVVDQDQLNKIEPLAKEIKGVKSVLVNATLKSAAEPAPAADDASTPIKTQTNAP
jgi:hypothetical protein